MIVRPPAVSGRFYPSDAGRLSRELDRLLEEAGSAGPEEGPGRRRAAGPRGEPLAILVPHAAYVYSGPVAARAWHEASHLRPDVVVLIGPDHFTGFPYVAVYGRGSYGTPLGPAPIDEELARALVASGRPLLERPEVHAREHSLEVQVPFVQRLFPGARIVPILMGYRSAENVESLAEALTAHLGGRSALLVASSDLSHYHDRRHAEALDARVIERIEEMNPSGLSEDLVQGRAEACGGDPLVTVLEAARRLGGSRSVILEYADSGRVNGDTGSVVGYLAAAVQRAPDREKTATSGSEKAVTTAEVVTTAEDVKTAEVVTTAEDVKTGEAVETAKAGTWLEGGLSDIEARQLFELARRAVIDAAAGEEEPLLDGSLAPSLLRPGGAFVTLTTADGQLRGCVGFHQSLLPLAQTVVRAARAATTCDSRFAPVEPHEAAGLSIHISILSELRPALPADIEIGRHGLYLSRGPRRGLLLPQVPVENGWNTLQFLAETCRKAGLPPDAWEKGASIEIFETVVISEQA